MKLDVVGIGNAIVDILAHTGEEFLYNNALPKGIMTLIEMEQAEHLYNNMAPAQEMSGGSAANTIAGLAAFGGKAGFIGRVRNDQLGGIFRHDLKSLGVVFTNPPADDGPPTGRSLVFITPDGERTMCTYLGAASELAVEDIDADLIRDAQIVYLEGYLWDREGAKNAFLRAADIAHKAGRKVALTLSDPFCVERHRESFLNLVTGHVDILFANEDEILALFQMNDFDAAFQAIRGHVDIAVLTRSEKGSLVATNGDVHVIDANPVEKVIDATGAGDLYAGGFLYGLTHGFSLYDSGRLGSLAAANIITQVGPRPQTDLSLILRNEFGMSL